jgi:hypothetical protein
LNHVSLVDDMATYRTNEVKRLRSAIMPYSISLMAHNDDDKDRSAPTDVSIKDATAGCKQNSNRSEKREGRLLSEPVSCEFYCTVK